MLDVYEEPSAALVKVDPGRLGIAVGQAREPDRLLRRSPIAIAGHRDPDVVTLGLGWSQATWILGDVHIHVPPFGRGSFDLVVIHQVLHYLDDPARALREAAHLVAPGGRILVVDFAPHRLEFLRESQAHRRLGFAREQVASWLQEAGLDCTMTRELAPPKKSDDQLTVTIWLGQDRRTITDWPLAASNREVA